MIKRACEIIGALFLLMMLYVLARLGIDWAVERWQLGDGNNESFVAGGLFFMFVIAPIVRRVFPATTQERG